MTLNEALAFRLPSGKTLGEASPDDWAAEAGRLQRKLDELEALDAGAMTEQDRQHMLARMDRMREFNRASEVVKAHLRRQAT